MSHPQVEQWLPLVTAVLWFSAATVQVARDRFRTWTEAFYLATCFFLGGYALSDTFYFNAPTIAQARVAALTSFSSLTLAAAFFMLFGVVFASRMRRWLLLAIVPAIVLLPFLWAYLPEGFRSLHGDGTPPYLGTWDDFWFTVWTGYVLMYSALGAGAFYLTYRKATGRGTKLRRRMRLLMASIVLVIALGSMTNVLRGLLELEMLPLFSSALAVPAAVALYTLAPSSKERLSAAVRRWKARRYDVKAAFLIYRDGTLIGAKTAPGEPVVDQDLFSGTLDVIQNFMRTSFPGLRGKWLRSVRHGDYSLVIERGKWAYMTLVLAGQESDQLRRQMRDELLAYESTNDQALERWEGVLEDAVGTDELLSKFFFDKMEEEQEIPIDRPRGAGPVMAAAPGSRR